MSSNEQFPVQVDERPYKERLEEIDNEIVDIDGRNPQLEAILKSERARLLGPHLTGILGIDLEFEMPQEDYLADRASAIDLIADYEQDLKCANPQD